jgi:hypothetical protein
MLESIQTGHGRSPLDAPNAIGLEVICLNSLKRSGGLTEEIGLKDFTNYD